MASVIDVRLVVNSDNGKPGLIYSENLSITLPSCILTADNSMILSVTADSPVVSKSKATKVVSLSNSEMGCKLKAIGSPSSTRLASIP